MGKQSEHSGPSSHAQHDLYAQHKLELPFPTHFKRSPPKVPYKAIALATVLFLIGSLLIIIGALLLAGYFGVTHTDRTVPVLIIGILVFLPGIYHLRIAYYASKGYPGYSYDDIPDFDD
ncbi:Transmembrane protein 230 [Oryzias melastigma]|uniref:Transmembrane protein 230 n=1 Tax=Oryzias melastigma TaxID=30732 RepID=A0A834CCF7_ORYME|nr:Transmembrane protein 230 [Oryzias melastigma]